MKGKIGIALFIVVFVLVVLLTLVAGILIGAGDGPPVQTTSHPAGTAPAAGQPAAGQPAPAQAGAAQPATGQPANGQPSAAQPAAAQPAAGQADAGQAAPAQAAPAQTAPAQTAPAQTAPAQTAPAQTAPAQAAPAQAAPAHADAGPNGQQQAGAPASGAAAPSGAAASPTSPVFTKVYAPDTVGYLLQAIVPASDDSATATPTAAGQGGSTIPSAPDGTGATAGSPQLSRTYTLQTGQFSDRSQAEAMANDLLQRHYRAYLVPVEDSVSGSSFYVRVGLFNTLWEAEDAQATMLNFDGMRSEVVRIKAVPPKEGAAQAAQGAAQDAAQAAGQAAQAATQAASQAAGGQ